MPPLDAVREVLRPRALPERPHPLAAAAARAVAERGGSAVRSVIFFGSRKTQARPDAWSAWDFFVLVSGYGAFYRALGQARALRRPPALAAALNAVMPPNSIAIRADDPGGGPELLAKCAVVALDDFRRDTSERHRDHFVVGRLFQPAEVVYAASAADAEEALSGLARAAALTLRWVRPWLPARFDAADYTRTLLRVSFAAEIRPEPEGRAGALWEVQKEALLPVYSALLDALTTSGDLVPVSPGMYALARPVTRAERLRRTAYFRLSLLRATARWAKYVVTFEGWLDFILRKARRHTGEDIVLTARERRLPLVFLWPRVFRYLREKDSRRGGAR